MKLFGTNLNTTGTVFCDLISWIIAEHGSRIRDYCSLFGCLDICGLSESGRASYGLGGREGSSLSSIWTDSGGSLRHRLYPSKTVVYGQWR